ncbi:MAG: noncanonical pyrimidine nucleotidase, YjjG family [Bacteroidota bacterium]|nr:MAG: noncanonical pyrimidine nucleotidase, YjjG family [Bacteroidota bacterium]
MKKLKHYSHLIFDLDHTLWDTNVNAAQSLSEMYHQYSLEQYGIISEQDFIQKYVDINNRMWTEYSLGRIKKSYLRAGRFELTLKYFGIVNPELVEKLSDFFVQNTPGKKELIPFAKDLLNHVHGKYQLAIITNGFSEAQHTKLRSSSIDHFFSKIIISEEIGYHKPDPRIFLQTAELLQTPIKDCLMIGDNIETDIAGAIASGMDCAYLNPVGIKHNYEVTFETHCLSELIKWL